MSWISLSLLSFCMCERRNKKEKEEVCVCVCSSVCISALCTGSRTGDKLIRSRMLRARTDEKDGGPAVVVCIYRMTQQLLSPVFSLFL